MKLLYRSQDNKQIVFMKIDRKNKKFWLSTSKTEYGLKEKPWRMLFDSGKETAQDISTSKMDDHDFIRNIDASMLRAGYIKDAKCPRDGK